MQGGRRAHRHGRGCIEALKRAETAGIVFIDEIDKIASGDVNRSGAEPRVRGVQRDHPAHRRRGRRLSALCAVHTDHILFVAAGAFHAVRPSELAPELQGRFPIRVELNALGEEDLCRILTEPRGALIDQYAALLAADGVGLRFSPDAIRAVARCAYEANMASENMGARRLPLRAVHAAGRRAFDAPALPKKKIYITSRYVAEKLGNYLEGRPEPLRALMRFLCFSILWLCYACAKVGPPQGGPVDETPPSDSLAQSER